LHVGCRDGIRVGTIRRERSMGHLGQLAGRPTSSAESIFWRSRSSS
jgi:hypothetical protein